MRRLGGLLAAAILALVVLGVYITQTAHAVVLDSGTNVDVVRTDDPYHYGRQFAITVDGPVTLEVKRASVLSSSGGCHTTLKGTSGPHRSPVPTGAICDGPGSVIGDTPVYNYGSCVDDVWTVDNLVVLADGVEVFNDTGRYGACPVVTTTTTAPPTTTIPPTTTTTVPGSRYCVQWAYKPRKHCLRWSGP